MIKFISRNKEYFINQVVGITLWWIYIIISWVDASSWCDVIIYKSVFFDFVSTLVVCILLVSTYLWASNKQSVILVVVLFFVVISISPIILFLLTDTLRFLFWPKGYEKMTIDNFKGWLIRNAIFFTLLSAIFFLTRFRIQYYLQKEATYKAESLAKDALLKMLRYQINPHFLFNTLNSLHALIDENKEKAKQLVINIAEYYRITLNKLDQKVEIYKEVDAIMQYLEIQKIRFEEKFEYEVELNEKVKNILIPSFIIHLLIENAVKYGIKTSEQLLRIKLMVILQNNNLIIEVSNTGKLEYTHQDINSSGTGIENIKSRLQSFYGDNFCFTIKEERGWVIAAITIREIKLYE